MMHVRLRIDGALVDVQPVALAVAPNVVSRVKVLAKMDISERRLPQDGQIAIDLEGGKRVQLRVSTFPASQGEKVVMRILSSQQIIAFDQLGLDARAQATLRSVLARPQGFVVTSGPTGAGKTSTLYALMQLIDPRQVNVVTLEDPIEVEMYGGLTLTRCAVAAGLPRSPRPACARDPAAADPGDHPRRREDRDSETANGAHPMRKAALFRAPPRAISTLHTSAWSRRSCASSTSAYEPWICRQRAAPAVLAAGLVRVVSATMARLTAEARHATCGINDELLLPAGSEVVVPRGCDKCMRTGYRGRTGLFEVAELDDELRELIKAKAPARAAGRIWQAAGSRPAPGRPGQDPGRSSTVDEVLRVT